MNRTEKPFQRTKQTDVNYGQLDRVLRSFGFIMHLVKEEPPARVYKHQESGASIMLPVFPESEGIQDYHLVAARVMLDNYGIAQPKVFAAELEKAG